MAYPNDFLEHLGVVRDSLLEVGFSFVHWAKAFMKKIYHVVMKILSDIMLLDKNTIKYLEEESSVEYYCLDQEDRVLIPPVVQVK